MRVGGAVVKYLSTGAWTDAVLWHRIIDRLPPSTPLDDELDVIIAQRLAPLALDYISSHGVTISSEAQAKLRRSDFTWSALGLSVASAGAAVMTALESAGIATVAFKGPAIRQSYQMGRHRLFSDIDLLVHPDDYGRGRDMLMADGWHEDLQSQMPYDSMNFRCREAQNLNRGPGERIDLHHQIPPWLWTAAVNFTDVYEDSVVMPYGRVMSPEWNLLIASLHLVSDKSKPGQTLIIWRDLAELSRAVDVPKMRALAESTGLSGWLFRVLYALPPAAKHEQLLSVLGGGHPPHRIRLALLSSNKLVRSRAPLVQLFRLPAPRAALFAVGMAFPAPRYIRSRYGSLLTGYRHWWTGR